MKYEIKFAHAIRPSLVRFIISKEGIVSSGYSVVIQVTGKTTDEIKKEILSLLEELEESYNVAVSLSGVELSDEYKQNITGNNRETDR